MTFALPARSRVPDLAAVPLAGLPPIDPVLTWLLRDEDARVPVVTLDSPVIQRVLGGTGEGGSKFSSSI